MMSEMSLHGEWLSLMDISGPFLAEPVLKDAFPQGLEEVDPAKRKLLRQAYEEWRDAVEFGEDDLQELHGAWIDLVLRQGLELDEDADGDILKSGDELPDDLTYQLAEHGVSRRPDYAVVDDQSADKGLMLISVYAPGTDLNEPLKSDGWAASPAERMVELCRAKKTRLGLVTNGEHWMLVDAPVGAVTTFASWYARLWSPEPKTLQSFINLLGVRRFFVGSDEQLPALLDASLKLQDEVTDALGEQVSRAVEVLIQSLDRADVDRNRELLKGIESTALYEAGLTVMMRIVFLLSAEERGLLLMGDDLYEANYAVSTLRMQLRAESEEILERRFDAWARLLAIFRAVYGGIDHEELRLPALGGSLFDPNRFPFLEGRPKDSDWRTDHAVPLPIDNRTVLLLLDAVQLFQGRTLSYRALDIEQIGYVYEGLLERTVVRAKDVTLDLNATKSAKKPWLTLDELEAANAKSDDAVAKLLKERTGSSANRVKNDLGKAVEAVDADKLLTACHADINLRDRIKPYFHFLRIDRWGYPLVYPVGTFMVTTGTDRRETGTHYTPKSLTEAIVKETLEPVAYVGPSEGKDREDWILKSPEELLDLKVCDPAMGSGAFLVQVCRWLSDRLVEAWREAEDAGKAVTAEGEVVELQNSHEPMRNDPEERLLIARRLIAERCLYGVDINPLAVELAKLSIWLVTLSKGRPFGFLDHNFRSGDSLLGIHDLDQLLYLDMKPSKASSKKLFATEIDKAVAEAVSLRAEIRSRPIVDIRDVEAMADLDEVARKKLETPVMIADALVSGLLAEGGTSFDATSLSIDAGKVLAGDASTVAMVRRRNRENLGSGSNQHSPSRKPFHWVLEFPEVFNSEGAGFDAIVGNPPFIGNKFWKARLGDAFPAQAKMILGGAAGKIDMCVLFHRRAETLLRDGGAYGLLAADNIAEGSAISKGLAVLASNGDIYFSIKGMPWPGKAAVSVSLICYFKGSYQSRKFCNGVECDLIGPRLEPGDENTWEVKKLKGGLFSFEGVNNSKGLAFVVSPEDTWFDQLKEEEGSLLVPYVTGDDITSHALNDIKRWALDIADMDIKDIQKRYPRASEFLQEVVKPTRTQSDLKSYKGLVDRWWQFWNHRADLMRKIRKSHRFVAFSKVTKYPICMLAPSNWIFTNQVVLIGLTRGDEHPICLSSFFGNWLNEFSGGRLEGRLRLSISESIAKFPVPETLLETGAVSSGEKFNSMAIKWAAERSVGMTGVMNAINSPECKEDEIDELRRLLCSIDEEVAKAYNWEDIDLSRAFVRQESDAVRDQWRYQISLASREQIQRRLVELNRVQFETSVSKASAAKQAEHSSSIGQENLSADLFHRQEGFR